MSSKNFVLAYCSENYNTAKKFEDDLGKAGIRFDHLSCDSIKESHFSKNVIKSENTVFLLISDNFLRSTHCMYEGLKMLNTCLENKCMQPVIIDGEFYNKNTSSFQSFPTEFSRISDLIKYMNHWQEHYLKMRKNKINISENQEPAFNKELKRVRSISAEIGEFLRLLRETNYWTINDLTENYYELFFNKIGKQDLLIKYKGAFANAKMNMGIKEQIVEPEDDSHGEIPEVIKGAKKPLTPTPSLEQDNSDKLSEIEKKKQATYDIIADIFDDEEEETDQNSESTNDKDPKINELDNAMTWNEIISDDANMPFNDKEDFFNKIAHLIDNDEDHLALKQLDLFLNQHPDDPDAYLWLARIAINEEDFLLAKANYEKSIDINDQNPQALTEYGQVIFHHFKDQQKRAAKAFNKTIALDGNNIDAHYFYALLLTEVIEKPKKAIKFFEKTLQLAPAHPFANYDLAFLYYNQKNKRKAAQHYEYAFTINPELRVPENDKAFWYNDYLEQKDKSKKSKKKKAKKDFDESEIEMIDTANVILDEPASSSEETTKSAKKTVLITGATSGIGKATAEIFAKNGYRIILTGRRKNRLKTMKKHFGDVYEVEVHILNFDVRNWVDSQRNLEALPEEWQEIDLLINNAGLAKGYAPVHEGDLNHWEAMIDTNIKGLLYMCRLVTPGMVKRQKGQIINICSSAGHEVYPNDNVYCATKHAVDALTKGLRLELYHHGIRVSQISPGHVEETEFAAVRFDGDQEQASIYNDFQPLKSTDVADSIFFIATRPQHVTIQDIVLMGTQQASNIFIDRSGRK